MTVRARTVYAGAVALVTVLSVWARAQVPVAVIAYAEQDDAGFVRRARDLLDTGWLGPYGPFTLAKGPGYPLFLVLAHRAHLDLQVAQQVVQLLAAAALGWGVARFARSRALGLVLYAAVALDPAYLGIEAARVNRTGLYASLSTLLLGLLLLCCTLPPLTRRRPWPWAAALLAGLGTGAAAAACLLTREERLALLPVVAAVLAAGLVRLGAPAAALALVRRRRPRPAGLPPRLLAGALALGLAAGTAAAGFTAVERRDRQVYGVAAVTDFADGQFPALFAALSEVEAGPARPYVPISRAQRAAAYAASPTFSRLQGPLEGPVLRTWVPAGCAAVRVCDDLAGGWVTWALRQAAFTVLGPDATAGQVQDLFGRAAREVRAGCGSRYPCRTGLVPFLPDLSTVPVGALLAATGRGLAQVARFDPPGGRFPPGSVGQQAEFASVVGGVSPDPLAEQRLVARERGTWWRDGTRTAYRWLLLLGLPFAAVGLLWPRDRGQRAGQLAGLALVVVAVARIGLLALVDVTSFPAVATGYLLPAFDPAVGAVVLGCWCCLRMVRGPGPARAASDAGPSRSDSLTPMQTVGP